MVKDPRLIGMIARCPWYISPSDDNEYEYLGAHICATIGILR